ncbi:hypothetical protein BTJ40_20930 [Microbulbifer sp. A4B17]|uniref:hypothetical protein n=1 Tax=Microbulbifer sp. A4B17 TaxID=359370 RepID=UPI000D52B0E2|nr:hypothetical protein [Microbulbifer sp. A4B17]AWF83087.1 hypothetical protein BTJ40_20930 [Microbulbifer sp. A4B17]
MKNIGIFALALVLQFFSSFLCAETTPTEITVRAKAMDAKFIGTSIGGAMVIIRDADSGEILAKGLTQGSTGDTTKIMKTPRARYQPIADGAAQFTATLDISEPIFLTVEVLAPYIKKQARVVAQTQTWLVPGKPITGDGLIVEIPGMLVDLISPQTHLYTGLDQSPFEIRANVVMMCGCSLTDGGLWDGSKIEVVALIKRDGKPFARVPLEIQEMMNTFSAPFATDVPGVYEVVLYAYDPRTGNTGVDRGSFIVRD